VPRLWPGDGSNAAVTITLDVINAKRYAEAS